MREYLDQPREVSIETLTQCNAACTFCPYPTLERIGNKMPDEMIERLISEMESWTEPFFFSPFKVNEPLLDKRTIPVCEQVIERTLGIPRIFSNGTTLTPKNIEKVHNLKRVAHLWISLNSHIASEYKDLMNLDFNKTVKNIDYLHNAYFRHDVVLSTVGHPNDEFKEYCNERWPKFRCVVINKGSWLGYTNPDIDVVPDVGCQRWEELSIMSTGKVSLCCMDGTGDFAIGDVNDSTMLEVYQTTRERRLGMSRLDVYPCSTCTN